mmetsp:Transcript_58524/g.169805  ORF Transcript_58524/g.169805 Transcript_58524/m.169805 type:complete len:383 (-) Transcript_58524:285-1433(-)
MIYRHNIRLARGVSSGASTCAKASSGSLRSRRVCGVSATDTCCGVACALLGWSEAASRCRPMAAATGLWPEDSLAEVFTAFGSKRLGQLVVGRRARRSSIPGEPIPEHQPWTCEDLSAFGSRRLGKLVAEEIRREKLGLAAGLTVASPQELDIDGERSGLATGTVKECHAVGQVKSFGSVASSTASNGSDDLASTSAEPEEDDSEPATSPPAGGVAAAVGVRSFEAGGALAKISVGSVRAPDYQSYHASALQFWKAKCQGTADQPGRRPAASSRARASTPPRPAPRPDESTQAAASPFTVDLAESDLDEDLLGQSFQAFDREDLWLADMLPGRGSSAAPGTPRVRNLLNNDAAAPSSWRAMAAEMFSSGQATCCDADFVNFS